MLRSSPNESARRKPNLQQFILLVPETPLPSSNPKSARGSSSQQQELANSRRKAGAALLHLWTPRYGENAVERRANFEGGCQGRRPMKLSLAIVDITVTRRQSHEQWESRSLAPKCLRVGLSRGCTSHLKCTCSSRIRWMHSRRPS